MVLVLGRLWLICFMTLAERWAFCYLFPAIGHMSLTEEPVSEPERSKGGTLLDPTDYQQSWTIESDPHKTCYSTPFPRPRIHKEGRPMAKGHWTASRVRLYKVKTTGIKNGNEKLSNLSTIFEGMWKRFGILSVTAPKRISYRCLFSNLVSCQIPCDVPFLHNMFSSN